jgi:hypothetical protein
MRLYSNSNLILVWPSKKNRAKDSRPFKNINIDMPLIVVKGGRFPWAWARPQPLPLLLRKLVAKKILATLLPGSSARATHWSRFLSSNLCNLIYIFHTKKSFRYSNSERIYFYYFFTSTIRPSVLLLTVFNVFNCS